MTKGNGMRHRHHRLLAAGARGAARAGFTLLELLIGITITAILMALAVPSFQSLTLDMRLTSYANDMVASVMLARSEAINRNTVVTLCVAPTSYDPAAPACASGGWEQGYLITCPTNAAPDNTACHVGGTGVLAIQYKRPLIGGWKMTEASGLTAVAFQPTGTGATSSSFTICRQLPTVGTRERVLSISPTGRTAVTKTRNGACS